MRVLIIRADESGKQRAFKMMPYNNQKEIEECFKYMDEQKAKDFTEGKLTSYFQQDIGFDIIYTDDKSIVESFLKDNPEYAKYSRVELKSDAVTQALNNTQIAKSANGLAFYKSWECVCKAHELKLIRPETFKQIEEEDLKNFTIEIENRGCEKNQEFLRRVAKNIASEVKNDKEIVKSLRTGENRKKENQISFKNWIDSEGREFNDITYRNGGQAFSVLFDSDMNVLKSSYNNKVFVKDHEWTNMEETEEVKDCLRLIYNKLPEMEFNLWLADMGDNEIYKELKKEIKDNAPEISVSAYFPLSQLGSGYFTLEENHIQMAVNIKDKNIAGYMFRKIDEKGKPLSRWASECPEPKNPLCSIKEQLSYTGHVLNSGKDKAAGKFLSLEFLLNEMRQNYDLLNDENRPGMESMGIDKDLDTLLSHFKDINNALSLQSAIGLPIEIEEEKGE